MEEVSDFFKRVLAAHKNKTGKNYQQKTLRDRMDNFKNARRETRNTMIFQKRRIDENMTPINSPGPSKIAKEVKQPNKRLEMLQKWKIEKEKRKLEEKQKAKPLFKVYHVPVEIGLPNLEDVNKKIKGKSINANATSQFAPPNHVFRAPKSIKPIHMDYDSSILPVKFKQDLFHINQRTSSSEKQRVSERNIRAIRNQQTQKNGTEYNKSVNNKVNVNKKELNHENSCTQKPSSSRIQRKSNKSKINEPSLDTKIESQGKRAPNIKLKQNSVKNKNEKFVIKKQHSNPSSLSSGDQTEKTHYCPKDDNKGNKKSPNIKKNPNNNSTVADIKSSETEISEIIKSPKKPRKFVKNVGWNSVEVVGDQETSENINIKTPKTSTKKYKKTPRKEYKFDISDVESSDDHNSENSSSSTVSKNIKKQKQLRQSCSNTELIEDSGQKDCNLKSRNSTVGSASPDYPIDKSLIELNTSLHTPKKNNILEESPVYVSPYVTFSRGKTRARKEYQIRQSAGELTPEFNPDILNSTSPKAGADYFLKKLNNEINRIEDMCNLWSDYKNSNEIPEEASDMIDVAIGQSQLLISKKFKQFQSLIEQCKKTEYEEKPITCEDLHGFWDMVYIQVIDLDKRFNNLNVLKANNWQEIIPQKKPVVKRGRGRAKKVAANAALKNLIKAARDTKKSNTEGNLNLCVPQTDEIRVFEGGYYSVKSPIKVVNKLHAQNDTARSLRVSLLTDQTKNRLSSSPGLTMMRVSQAFKYGHGITPSKSILKNDLPKPAKRTVKSVLFKDNLEGDTEPKLICTKGLHESKDMENEIDKENNINEINLITFSPITSIRRSERLNKFKL